VRETRHAMIGARGLGEIADTGDCIRIIVKSFIEVPDAQEKNHAGVLAFQPGVPLEKVRLQSSWSCFTAFMPRSNSRDERCCFHRPL